MNKKLLITAITIASLGTASASSFLAGDPVEAVADKDTAYDNPAFLLTTENQLSFSDWGNVGYVFNAFDQKLAVHGGRNGNAVDVFWATTLGFGQLGIRAGYELDSTKGLSATSFNGQTNFTYLEEDGKTELDNGTDTFSLDLKENETVDKSSEAQIAAGFVLDDLPIDGTITLSLPSSSDTDSFSAVDVINTNGLTTTTYRETRTTVITSSTERTGGLVSSATGRYKLTQSTFITGGIVINNDEETTSARSVVTQYDENIAAPSIDTNETTTTDTNTVEEDKSMTLLVGMDHRKTVGAALLKLQPTLSYTSSSLTTTNKTAANTFVDVITPANNTTGPTGTTSITASEGSEIDARVNVSAELKASEKWTWRAGTTIDLLKITSSKDTTTVNKVDGAGTGYEKDYVQVTADSSEVEFLQTGYAIDLGFAYKPSENSVLDVNLNSNNNPLQNWTANFGFTFYY
jgi:hypothetical protein